MAKKSNQKLKLIYLAKIMLEQTDEENALTVNDIQTELSHYGVSAERKTVYSDIEMLRMSGLDISVRKSKTTQYFVASRCFELAELKLLVDAVQCSQFITHKKSKELIKKLEMLASKQQSKELRRQVYIDNRIKTVNESIYYNVDTLHSAIASDKKVTFRYFDYNTNKEKIYRKNKSTYIESPYGMIWEDDKYYMVAYKHKYGSFVHYRVDRMKDIKLTDDKRDALPPSIQFDMAQYTNKLFSMHSGEEQVVKLKCKNSLVNAIIDKFGREIEMEIVDKENFCISPKLQVSTNFFAWLFKFGPDAKIISPSDTAVNYKKYIKKVLSEYEKDDCIFMKGSVEDVDEIHMLIKKRIKWMDDNGIKQWNKTNYLSSYPKEYFESKALSGQLYVMKNKSSQSVVGSVVLLEKDERWGIDRTNSYYIHNLVSDTQFPGVGREIIQSCEEIAIKHGKEKIRLDCQNANNKINNFYSELGYEFVESFREGNYLGNKMEKSLNIRF